jgi:dTDP-glucose 4,6-dehydratase
VVITGGAGFVGSHLCRRFLHDGHEVSCVDNLSTGDIGNVEELLGNERFRFMRADVTDYLNVPGPVDAVPHFASPASPADYMRLPLETLSAGSTGTRNVLGLARKKDARFVLRRRRRRTATPRSIRNRKAIGAMSIRSARAVSHCR